MSDLSTPTPASTDSNDGADDNLESLREKLRAQRAQQRASLEKHKKTTFSAVESARKGTSYFDAKRIQEILDEEEDEETQE